MPRALNVFYFCAAGSSGLIPILFLRRWEFRASFLFYFCAAGSSVPHSYFIFALLGAPCLIPILFLGCWGLRASFLFYFALQDLSHSQHILFYIFAPKRQTFFLIFASGRGLVYIFAEWLSSTLLHQVGDGCAERCMGHQFFQCEMHAITPIVVRIGWNVDAFGIGVG